MAAALSGAFPYVGRHTEDVKSIVSAGRSRTISDHSNASLPTPSAIEADMLTSDSNNECSQSVTDKADGSHQSECEEHELSGYDDTNLLCNSPGSSGNATLLTSEAAQHQLEAASQALIDVWFTLRALESQLSHDAPPSASIAAAARPAHDGPCVEASCKAAAETEHSENQSQQQATQLAALPNADAGSVARACISSRLDVGPQLFSSGVRSIGHAETILTSAKRILDSTPGVATTQVVLGTAENIPTLFISTSPTSQESTIASVTAVSKRALLEAAASSQIVYIIGYEATPFEDKNSSTGFCATLAITPGNWQFFACWDILKHGICPRGPKCKWWHPGQNQIQPIQVVFH